MAMLVLLLAAVSMIVLYAPSRPQPARARRNLLQEDLLAAYVNQRADY